MLLLYNVFSIRFFESLEFILL